MASGSEAAGGASRRPLSAPTCPPRPLIARAFAWHEPWGDWAMPDPSDREERLHALIDADVRERFIPHGECWTIGAAATTLWIPPVGPHRTEVRTPRRGRDASRRPAASATRRELKRAALVPRHDRDRARPSAMGSRAPARPRPRDPRRRRRRLRLDTHTPGIAFYEHGFEVTARARPSLASDDVRPRRGGCSRGSTCARRDARRRRSLAPLDTAHPAAQIAFYERHGFEASDQARGRAVAARG